MASKLSNKDVVWQGHNFGLFPVVVNPKASVLMLNEARHVDERLVAMLSEENQFVLAHVLLSYRHVEWRKTDGEQWDGLHVELLANGGVEIKSSQRSAIKLMWEQRLGKKHP